VTRALDIGAIRARVRALDYVRGTPAEVAMWREGDAEARANRDRRHGPRRRRTRPVRHAARGSCLATAIVLKLLDHPDADPALAITPATIG
jgi:hypothetical protein